MGRNEQLDEGAGRQTWKCLDPLNCVAPAAFESIAHGCNYGTWVQTWTWHFRGTLHKSADPLTSVTGVSLGAVITQVRMVSKPANPETCCTICDQYRIAGVVVCKNFRAKT